jgi:ribosomal-protein-alanine N-acetyltransferase
VSEANFKRPPHVAAKGKAVPQPRIERRPMCAADLAEVAAAERRVYSFPWTEGNFSDSLAAGHSCWVFRLDGRLLGYGVMMLVLDEAHLLNIAVVAEQQQRGFGAMLMESLCGVAREAGARRMFLDVRPSNVAALALYRRDGFAEIGRRRGYYPGHGKREDGIVMARNL